MPKNKFRRLIYWDSSVFLSYINSNPQRVDIIQAHWDHMNINRDERIVTANISMLEVAYTEAEQKSKLLNPDDLQAIDDMWHDPTILLVDIVTDILTLARNLMRQINITGRSLKPFDATHLATALWVNQNVFPVSEIHTYDGQWMGFSLIVGIPILNPPDIRKPPPPPQPTQSKFPLP